MKEFYDKVIAEARKWEGTKEISGNQGFENEHFQHLMEICKWDMGQAWCAYFAELCWTVPTFSGKSKYRQIMLDLLSAGAVATFNNFRNDKSGLFKVDDVPVPGAIVIWQSHKNGKASWTGHAGVVVSVDGDKIITIEGNTNADGGREGIEVAEMKDKDRHDLTKAFKINNGLRLLGFIKLA